MSSEVANNASGVPCNERRVKVKGGTTLALRVWGNEEASSPDESKWLCLHGFLDNAATFDLVAPMMIKGGYASVMACCDLPGHGKSEKRQGGVYHAVDHIADAIHLAETLGWTRYSLMGHSYGGGIVQAMAAVVPERVIRVVAIEALGLLTSHPSQFTSNLRENILDRDRGLNIPNYASLEECALRRSTQNFVGAMPASAALVLVQRGTNKTENGFVWSSDATLMRTTRMRLDEGYCQDFLRGIVCPHALVFASDGLWRRAALPSAPLFSLSWRFLVRFAYIAAEAWNFLSTLGREPLVPSFMRPSSTVSKIAYVYHSLLCRFACLRPQSCALVGTSKGGHHPHLTHPALFLSALEPWLKKSLSAETDGGRRKGE